MIHHFQLPDITFFKKTLGSFLKKMTQMYKLDVKLEDVKLEAVLFTNINLRD